MTFEACWKKAALHWFFPFSKKDIIGALTGLKYSL